jgi:hypothetical protein
MQSRAGRGFGPADCDGERAHPAAVRGGARLVEWMKSRGVTPVLLSTRGMGAIGRLQPGEGYGHIANMLARSNILAVLPRAP